MLQTLELALGRVVAATPAPLRRIGAGKPIEIEGQVLDRDIQALLKTQHRLRLDRPPPSVEAERRQTEREARLIRGRPIAVGAVEERSVEGAVEPLAARLYVPENAPERGPLLVYLHGGGFVIGSLDTHDQPCRLLCREADTRVLSIAYRLAPEHRFPAAVDDAVAAFNHVVAKPGDFGAEAGRIAVGGDSAGGNLATNVARIARDAGTEPPAYQALIYPVCDRIERRRCYDLFGEGFYLTAAKVDEWMGLYGGPDEDPRVSPLRAPDLSGLAPAHILIAGFDPLRDECRAYAEALERAGTTVEITYAEDLVHALINMVGAIDRTRAALSEYARSLPVSAPHDRGQSGPSADPSA